MAIYFLNRFFYPDEAATSQYLSDLAFYLAGLGEDIHVVTGSRAYLDGRRLGAADESRHGVHIHRLDAPAGGSSLLARALQYPLFLFAAHRYLSRHLKAGDVLVAMTDPPLSLLSCARLARGRDVLLVTWLHDLFPEIARALRVPAVSGRVYAGLKSMRDRALRAADAHVVIAQAMAARLEESGILHERITLIRNWADGSLLRPVPAAQVALRRQWGLEGKTVFGYSGNLGRAHDWEILLDCAQRLKDRDDIRLLVIGHGVGYGQLAAAVRTRGMGNIELRPFQPRVRLPESLACADVHLVSLQPALEGLMSPSKLGGALAVGRPVIYLGDPHAELARLLRAEGAGLAVAPTEGRKLAEVMRELTDDPPRRLAMGERARSLFEARFEQASLLPLWAELLSNLQRGYRPEIPAESPRQAKLFRRD